MSQKKRRGRGEGCITQLPDGRWLAVLSAGKNPTTGKRRQIKFHGGTKREVPEKLDEAREARRKGPFTDAGRLTVADWPDKWLEIKRSKVEPATYVWYERRVRLHLKPLLGVVHLGKLTALHVENVLAEMCKRGDSASEQGKPMTTLRAALKVAVKFGMLPKNPASDVARPRATRSEMTCLDEGQARAFLKAASTDRLAALYDLALDTGMRPGEFFALHWAEVDLEEGTVFLRWSLEAIDGAHRLKEPKTTKARRKIRLARRTVEALKAHRERMRAECRDVERGLVFCDTHGGFLRKSNWQRSSFSPARRRAGLPHFRPYHLRHTSATLLLSRDVNIRVVSDRLGHEDIATTLKFYAHALPDMQQRAADAVDELFGRDCYPLVTK